MNDTQTARLSAAVEARLPFADLLFRSIRDVSLDVEGVTRPAWSERDQAAADILAGAARALDLEVGFDVAGNLLLTLPGRDRAAPGILTGSHLDSVPTGGHYDGLAGVVAGLTTLAAYKDSGITPVCDITAVGTRGEESVWYGIAYVGSRLMVGALPLEQLDALRRADSKRTLAEHMAEVGVDVAALRATGAAPVSPANTRAYLELHIEQGPVLVGEGLPVGIPTIIRGKSGSPMRNAWDAMITPAPRRVPIATTRCSRPSSWCARSTNTGSSRKDRVCPTACSRSASCSPTPGITP